VYYVLLILLYPLSILPFWVLYGLSDFACFIIYRCLKYRIPVVRENLQKAFPDKPEAELLRIEKAFYKGMCDLCVEMLKLLSISRKSLNRRFTGNWEVFREIAAEGKNGYAMLGHTFNWEWANAACPMHIPQQYACVYLPVSNTAVNRLVLRLRTRTGALMVSSKSLKAGLQQLQDKQHILALAADQNPAKVDNADWISFMNREAPFFRGPENMARRARAAVVFARIRKVKRGHYNMVLERVYDDAFVTAPGEITRAYVAFVEASLHAQPENYLWSHRRWKHRRST
jgi:KDO2-lipid IV(A) lauroyltransferase